MLLGEPPPTRGDLYFTLFGFPVRIHPFFWLVVVLLGLPRGGDPKSSLIHLFVWVVAVFVAILIHELGHALVMRAYGFAPRITLYGLGGMASYDNAQVYRSPTAGPWREILIAAAGPGAGFLLAAAISALVLALGYGIKVYRVVYVLILVQAVDAIGSPIFTDLVNNILFISVFWGMVNLLPVYPLDGGQIAREILLKVNPRNGIRQSLILSMTTATALAVIGLLQWGSLFVAIFFAYMAYTSYATLQAYSGRGPRW